MPIILRIFLLLLPTSCFAQNNTTYKNLALEGGGTRGVAYAGAFKVLEQKNILQHIENVAGSSAGAIAGLMICIGYNTTEIDSLLKALPFEQFNDGGGGLIGKYRRVKKKYGIYKGDSFEKWLQAVLLKKLNNADITFIQLHNLKNNNPLYKDLYCTATNISKQRLEVFSYKTSPNLSIATAVRISAGIPLYFVPIVLDDNLQKLKKNDTTSYKNYYVDGGMLCNYPISMFDSCINCTDPLLSNNLVFNTQTLGIKLERDEQASAILKDSVAIATYNPKKINDYLEAFGNLSTETINRKYPNLDNEKGRTIYINYGKTNARIKKMSVTDKQFLYNNGVHCTERFFELNKKLLPNN